MLHLTALVLLLGSFLVYAATRKLEPVISWIEDTPIETVCKRVGSVIGQIGTGSATDRNKSLMTPKEVAEADKIRKRMAEIQPTHLVQLHDGTVIFGAAARQANTLIIREFDGTRQRKLVLPQDAVRHQQRIVLPDERITAADWRFLIQFDYQNPYFMAPYVFASSGSFAEAHLMHTILSQLAADFERLFAPILPENAPRNHIHICQFRHPKAFYEQAFRQQAESVMNAAAFYSLSHNTLFIHQQAANAAERRELIRQLRHEGTHQLIADRRLLSSNQPPLWLMEGLAEHMAAVGNPATAHAYAQNFSKLATVGLLKWDQLCESDSYFENPQSVQQAYLHSWVLVRHLLYPTHKARFLAFLQSSSADHRSLTALANALEQPASKLIADALAATLSPKAP